MPLTSSTEFLTSSLLLLSICRGLERRKVLLAPDAAVFRGFFVARVGC
jgi:hypothetical protein